MIHEIRRSRWVIISTFIAALMLTMIPLPEWAELARPEWVSLVLIYWCMALPDRVGIYTAWFLGLILDVIHGSLLGQYALSLAVVAYFTLTFYQRLRIYGIWQQAFMVMILTLFQLLFIVWIRGVIGQAPNSYYYWMPALTTMILWPWTYLVLRDIRRHFRVS